MNKKKEIKGKIKKIIFNSENFYIFVLTQNIEKDSEFLAPVQEEIICKGQIFNKLNEGSSVKIIGNIVSYKGKTQLNVEFLEEIIETDRNSIISFLKTLKGVGNKTAEMIYEKFGSETINILDKDPKQLAKIPKIGKKKIETIAKDYKHKSINKKILLFAIKIRLEQKVIIELFKKYKENVKHLILKNPYIVVESKFLKFSDGDKVAKILEIFDPRSPYRIMCYIQQYINYANNGDTYIDFEVILQEVQKIVAINKNDLIDIFNSFEDIEFETKIFNQEKNILISKYANPVRFLSKEKCEKINSENIEEELIVSLSFLHTFEINIHNHLKSLSTTKNKNEIDIKEFIKSNEAINKIKYNEKQREAIEKVASNNLFILTGKAGVGKTAVSKAFLSLLKKQKKTVLMLAPTNKAVKRITEVTKEVAYTIHFAFFQDIIPHYDTIIVDEAGMISTEIAEMFMLQMNKHQQLILIGDVAQTPPVQPGNFLRDIIKAVNNKHVHGAQTTLEEILRTQKIDGLDSGIAVRCNDIAEGNIVKRPPCDDIVFIEENNDNNIKKAVAKLIQLEMSKGHDLKNIQVISPQYKKAGGINELNEYIQEKFNPEPYLIDPIKKQSKKIKKGDKVMQLTPMQNLQLTNADILYVQDIISKEIKTDEGLKNINHIVCRRDFVYNTDPIVEYPEKDFFLNTTLSYAASVHKMQGSEYDVVIYVLSNQHRMMLNRNLLYTGLSRGKVQVYIVGQKSAYMKAIKKEVSKSRKTMLNLLFGKEKIKGDDESNENNSSR